MRANRLEDNRKPRGDSALGGGRVRRGMTLAEVLIAMMVLAIGMMGILALFPIGAAQLAQAVKDERTSQLASIADGQFRVLWRNAWLDANGQLNSDSNAFAAEPAYQQLDYGTSATATTPSSPLYMDPVGIQGLQPALTVGMTATPCIFANNTVLVPRQAFVQTNSTTSILRLCFLQDDIAFNPNGYATTTIQRGDRYSASFLLQRPNNSVRQEVNLKVVVYQNRSVDFYSAETPIATNLSVTAGQDAISTSTGGVRNGGWILLAYPAQLSAATPVEAFADFYRVVGIVGANGTWTYSLSPPTRAHGTGTYTANAIYFSDVAEVFDRGTITPFEVVGR